MKYAELGSISRGTLCVQDLIPKFAEKLEFLSSLNNCSTNWDLVERAQVWLEEWEDLPTSQEPDNTDDLRDDLIEALNTFAPPYCYFGVHPGDGADFGFYVIEDIEDTFEGLRVRALSEIPDDYEGEELLVVGFDASLHLWPSKELIWSI